MEPPGCRGVTELLTEWRSGRREALDDLLPLVYDELLRLAKCYMRRERRDHTLQPTALVHEAYVKLLEQRRVPWQNRAHFLAVAARLMRRILVDHVRARAALKRGGRSPALPLDEADTPGPGPAPRIDLIALDDALDRLARLDVRQCRIVELRYFGGLTIEETAEVIARSPRTVKREWEIARAWLFRELNEVRDDARRRPCDRRP